MSVTGFMYNINATKKLGEVELNEGYEGNRSWHHQYKDSAYVYIGGLHPGFTEGDVVIVFSQFGEIVDVNLIRDKNTGKSKGFAYLCYEDQRSTILAVDNMNGYQLLNRTLRVDHVAKYKAPKKTDEDDLDENGDPKLLEYVATGAEGKGQRAYNVLESQKKIHEVVNQKKKTIAIARPEDEDEAWAKAFEASLQQAGGVDDRASLKDTKKSRKHKMDIQTMKKETKRMEKEVKEAEKELKELKKLLKGKATKKKRSLCGVAPMHVKGEVKKHVVAKAEASSEDSSDSSLDEDDGASSEEDDSEPKTKRKKQRG